MQRQDFVDVVRMRAAGPLVLEHVEEMTEQVAAFVDVRVEQYLVGARQARHRQLEVPFAVVDLMLIMRVMRSRIAAGTFRDGCSAGVFS